MIYIKEYIALVILNILDVLSTIYFLEFDIFSEGNPLAAYLMSKLGYIGLIIPKIGMLGFFAYLLIKHKEELSKSKVTKFGMYLMLLVYIVVVTINIGGITLFYIG
jgi:hypothetical protein